MKLLADENIPVKSIEMLRENGMDVKSIGIDHLSISDKEVIEIAQNEGRLIITFDSDYGDLIFVHGFRPSAGVVYFRIHQINYKEFANIVLQLMANHTLTFENKLTVYDGKRRQRSYHQRR